MRTSAKTICGLAIVVLMLTGAMASAQKLNGKSARPAVPGATAQAANQKQTKSTGNMQNAQSNPMYKENQNEGSMPQHQAIGDDNDPARHHPGKNETTTVQPPANTASHETVEYKDPEDMTTRYRPGNNKTSSAQPSSGNVKRETVEYKDPEDMTTRYRPGNNKTTTVQPKGKSGSASSVEYKDPEDMTTRSTAPANKTARPN